MRGLTRRQWIILGVAWFGWVFDIMDTALFNFAKVPMLTEMLGAEQYKLRGPALEGEIQTIFLIGWSIGGLGFGILADQWGRSRTLIVTILVYSLLTGLTSFCQTPEQVMVLRFLTALGIGGEWAAGAALVAETFPDKARAPAAGLLQSAAAFGPALGAVANLALAGQSWRWLFVVGVLPALVCVAIRALVKEPEVPRTRTSPLAPLRELFADPKLRRNVLIAMVLGVVGVTGAGIAPFWLPNLVKEASTGLDPAEVARRLSYATFIFHGGTLTGVLLFPLLCEKLGRRGAFGLFFLLSPLALLVALYGGVTYERVLWLMPLNAFFAIGLSAGFALYFPELFPGRLRATGTGLAYNVGRIFSAPVPWVTGILITQMNGSVAVGVLMAASIYLIGLLAVPFAPETKGQALEA
ncbi:MAG: MFS transporter [Fimbriimonas sp.]